MFVGVRFCLAWVRGAGGIEAGARVNTFEIMQAEVEMDDIPMAAIEGQPAREFSHPFGCAFAILHVAIGQPGADDIGNVVQPFPDLRGVANGDGIAQEQDPSAARFRCLDRPGKNQKKS